MRKMFVWLLMVLLAATPLAAAEPYVDEVSTVVGDNVVAYPQLQQLADADVQQRINDDVVLASDASRHLVTLVTLGNSPWGLQVTHDSYLDTYVFSTVISAMGKMPTGRQGHAYTALSYDLARGERLTLGDLFTDVDAAVAYMESIAADGLEQSGYVDASALAPIPRDSFTLDGTGITFWYPARQYTLLSGYSGACHFYFSELTPYLIADENGLPAKMGLLQPVPKGDALQKAVAEAVTLGELPGMPVRLGDSIPQVLDAYRLMHSPDEFPGGRFFVLEAPVMRGVRVISDTLMPTYDHSVVEGLQLRRGSLYGLLIGQTQREEWLSALGTPDETIPFSENMAYDYNLPTGCSDVYRYGEHELHLHADDAGTLRAIRLSK